MKINGIEFTIGADPEFFLKKNGSYVPAHEYGEGSKMLPHAFGDKGEMQVDGLAIEANIKPASTAVGFRSNILQVMEEIRNFIPEDIEFCFDPVAEFDTDVLEQVPGMFLELGCQPDYNAYTGKKNPRPRAKKENLRAGGGHIHIGWTSEVDPLDPDHFMACRLLTQQLDTYLYSFSKLWDEDEERQKLYGKPGAFRPKPYGVEYRVLSNAWLRRPEYISAVYKLVRVAIEKSFANRGSLLDTYEPLLDLGYWANVYRLPEIFSKKVVPDWVKTVNLESLRPRGRPINLNAVVEGDF